MTAVVKPDGVVQERYLYDSDGRPTARNANWGALSLADGYAHPTSTMSHVDWKYLYGGQRWEWLYHPAENDGVGSSMPAWGLYEGGGGWYDAQNARWLQPDLSAYQKGSNAYDPGVVKYNYWGLGESEMLGHHAETITTVSAVGLGIFAGVLTGGLAMWALPGLVTASGALTAGGTLLVGTAGGAGGGFVYGGIDTSSFTWSWSGAMKGGAAGAIGGFAGAGAGILARGAAQAFGLTCQAGRGLAGAALIGSAEGGIGGFAGGFAQGAFDTGTLAGAWHAGWTSGLMGLGMGAGLGALFHRVCFVAGTQVVTGVEEEGAAETPAELAAGGRGSGVAAATRVRYVTVPIEQLVACGGGEMGDGGGQHVLARDQHDPAGPLVRRRIGRTYERTAYHLRVVGIRDGDGREQTVRVTDEHPFFVAGRGWTKAKDLSAGDRLLGAAGEASTVISNLGEAHPEGVTVYNLEVEDDHTYFVRAEGSDGEAVWVHNANYSLTVPEPRIFSSSSLTVTERRYLAKHFRIKATALRNAARRGELKWSPNTGTMRLEELQVAHRLRVTARYQRMWGRPLDMARLNADHPADLIVGGLANQRLRMLNESINKSVGASLSLAGRRAGLQAGDTISEIHFIAR